MVRTAHSRQLFFDLGHRPALEREDFLVAPCNREAVDWIDRWPDWPSPALAISGAPESGKSHLAAVWQERSGGNRIDAADVGDAMHDVSPENRHWLVDPADKTPDQEGLLHLYNRIAEFGGSLLLTGQMPPARWGISLADLASRLRTAPVAVIGQPDDELLGGVLVKLFSDRQVRIRPEVVSFLLPRMERSFDAASALVEILDRQALSRKRPITVPFVRSVLDFPEDG